MAQGYLHSFTIAPAGQGTTATELSFKNITYDERPTTINIAQRLRPDGSVNPGFNEELGDLLQLNWTVEELLDSAVVGAIAGATNPANPGTTNLSNLAAYAAGITYRTPFWQIFYNGVQIYSGTGFFIEDTSGRASIPGDATFRMSFKSLMSGFSRFGVALVPGAGQGNTHT